MHKSNTIATTITLLRHHTGSRLVISCDLTFDQAIDPDSPEDWDERGLGDAVADLIAGLDDWDLDEVDAVAV